MHNVYNQSQENRLGTIRPEIMFELYSFFIVHITENNVGAVPMEEFDCRSSDPARAAWI